MLGVSECLTRAAISRDLVSLRTEASRFTGGLRLIGEALELLAAIASDGYSPLNFHRLLIAQKQARYADPRIADSLEHSLTAVINQIGSMLQSNASLYFAARYQKAINEVRSLIERLCASIMSLPDDKLLALPSRSIQIDIEGVSRTGRMRQRLRELESILPLADLQTLYTLLENVQTLISTESAEVEMRRIKRAE
jgi:hypothetical protein